jgi:hypothetical protein
VDLEKPIVVVWFLVETRGFSLLATVQTSMRAHAVSYSVSKNGSFARDNVARA